MVTCAFARHVQTYADAALNGTIQNTAAEAAVRLGGLLSPKYLQASPGDAYLGPWASSTPPPGAKRARLLHALVLIIFPAP